MSWYDDVLITKMIHDTVVGGNVPTKELARQLGKPYSTLMRELNPFDTHAKLGADTLFDIMRITGEVDVLRHMAREMGFELVRTENTGHMSKATVGREAVPAA